MSTNHPKTISVRDWPIQQKLTLVIMLTCGAVLLLACVLLGGYQFFKFRETLVRNSTVLADLLAKNTQAALSFQDETAAQETLQALQADSDVTAACLYDTANARVAAYSRNAGPGLFPDRPGADGYHFESSSLVVFRPVTLNDRRIGTIYVQTSLEGLYEQLRLFSAFAVFVLIVSGLAGLGLSARLQRPISHPLHALTETARNISHNNDFTIRVQPQSQDEVGQLGVALNQLLGSIEQRDKALRATNELLRSEISERTAAQKELAASEQRLQALMQALPVGVSFSKDETCEFITGNAALLAQVDGAKTDNISASAVDTQAHGRQLQFFHDGVPITAAELPLQRAVAENREIKPYELEVVLPSGRRWIMEGSGAPIHDEQGKVIGGVAVTVDITDRKRVEDALKDAHRELAEKATQLETVVEQRTAKLRETIAELEAFSYSIAHDMRAPLRSLQGFSEILLSEYADKLDADGQRFLERISSSAGRMDNLIQDVLSYSRVVRSDFPMVPVDVGLLLKDMLETYPMFAPEKADIVIEEPLPQVLGNEAMLTQVFSNLMGNAVKFVSPGVRPRLKIWAESGLQHVRIFVQDNGIGIARDQYERIFAIFQRVSNEYDGTGIGLAIVKKAVERMGGKLGLQSAVNHGSVFWVEVQNAKIPRGMS